MVKINKIYTRTGDDGTTGLTGKTRVSKHSPRIEAIGDVDELGSFIGEARTFAESIPVAPVVHKLAAIQNELFDIGAQLAVPPGESCAGVFPIVEQDITRLEAWIDELCEGLPELRSFVLAGGTVLNAALHKARSVCRRAERHTLLLATSEPVDQLLLKYLNRLSDLLFAMARFESHRAGAPEYLWEAGRKNRGITTPDLK